MVGIAMQHNIGAYLRAEPLLPPATVTYVSSDGTAETVGRVIDRLALGRNYNSVKVVVPYNAVTQSSLGVISTVRLLGATASDGSFASVAAVSTSTGITRTSATTTTATSTSHAGAFEYNYDLRNAPRFIQFGVHVRPGASSSGAVGFSAVGIFGGADELPSTIATAGFVDRATTS
jgi:hypothetical protein